MNKVIMVSLAVALLACPAFVATAQDNWNMLAGFSITVERTRDKVTVKCETGCTWGSRLTFASDGNAVEINEHGVVADQPAGRQRGPFIIKIEGKNGEVALTCEKGCA
jgi:hypothetical protein